MHASATTNAARSAPPAGRPAVAATPEPKLAPPGAGIPAVDRFVFGWVLRARRALTPRERVAREFMQERARIAALTAPLTAARATQRVLIPPQRGLEDSSRFWSVWMTLDHLRIVHAELAQCIPMLARGIAPPRAASTAAVKPAAQLDARVVAAYEDSCDVLLRAFERVPELRGTACYAHPWFGPLDAAGWQVLSAAHLRIHRVQIEHILRGIDGTPR
ncbi:MAG: hypothetical protein U0625_04825 [Phycisphaerales bacterium]